MKSGAWILVIVMFFSINGLAQNGKLKFSTQHRNAATNEWQSKNFDVTLGYIPKKGSQGLKSGFSFNNILFRRLGLYTSFEYGFNSDDFSNLVGGTITVNEYVYFFGGLDLFSQNGFIQTKSTGVRKELGIGFVPYKKLVVQLGGSLSVGLSISAGYKITW